MISKLGSLDSFCFSMIACGVNDIYDILAREGHYKKIMYVEVDVGEIFFEEIYHLNGKSIDKGLIFKPDITKDFVIILGSGRDFLESLSKRLSYHIGINFILMELNTEKSDNKKNGFTIYDGITSKKVREVASFENSFGKMKFTEAGEPMYFENPEYYKREKATDKINKEIILEYVNKIGVDIGNDKIFETSKKCIFIDQEE